MHPPVSIQRGDNMNRFINVVLVASGVLFAFIYAKAVASAQAVAENDTYVVPAKSNKYHYPSCRWAKKPGSGNLAIFHSAKDALGAGYVPCKVCRPPDED